MKLHFIKEELQKLIDITNSSPTGTVPYTGPDWEKLMGPKHATKKSKGLCLVGDEGVYFMSNSPNTPSKKTKKTKLPEVAYALECNPKTLGSLQCYDTKRASFGADDGCEFFELKKIEDWVKKTKGQHCTIDIDSKSIDLL
jgi:hypothetical protein